MLPGTPVLNWLLDAQQGGGAVVGKAVHTAADTAKVMYDGLIAYVEGLL